MEDRINAPYRLNPDSWSENWKALDAIGSFWDSFEVMESGKTLEETQMYQISLQGIESKRRKEFKTIEKSALFAIELEKRKPKMPALRSPEFTNMTRTHLRLIGEISEYARLKKWALIKFFI